MELAAHVQAYPLRERLRARLMTALYRGGRQAEALRSARDYRALLADQEGLDPGQEILDAETAILRAADPTAGPPATERPPPDTAAPDGPPPPAQLPPMPGGFVARDAELVTLDGCLAGADGAPRVLALVGPGGAGKTTLALHWAHRRLADFDGGQLYVNLHGFGVDPQSEAFDALGQLLRGLGQPHDALPASVDERSAAYRSLVAGRRMLIVLDNAASSGQVRPLLPGAGSHVTLITSRRRLDGLAAGEGIGRLTVDALSAADAMTLLRRHVTAGHVDDATLAEVSRLAEGLPLALRVVAARLNATHPDRIGTLVADLADERRRLAVLSLPADDTAVRGAFAASSQALSPPARAMLQTLGLLLTSDTSLPACAAAAGRPVSDVEPLLEELRACHLVQRAPADRYQMHDLMRLYARELAEQHMSEPDRTEAEGRLLAWYVAAADRADGVIRPHRGHLFEPLTGPGDVPDFGGTADALAWFDLEAENLLRAVERAERHHPGACWRLAAVMFGWLDRHQRRTAWVPVCQAGCRAAAATADPQAIALMHNSLGVFNCYLERYDQAADAFVQVLAVRRELGQPRQIATTLMNLGNAYVQTGRLTDALPCLEETITILSVEPEGESLLGAAHNNLGWAHHQADRFDEAIACYTVAVTIAQRLGDPYSISCAESNLATAHSDCGRDQAAADHWRTALDHARRAGDIRLEAEAFAGLGKAYIRLGEYDAARRDLARALDAYTSTGDGRTAEVAALLATVAG
jgi:tetratricopeptide (TPR) repeat protein